MKNLFLEDLNTYKVYIEQELKNTIYDIFKDGYQESSNIVNYIEDFYGYCKDGKYIRAYLVKLGYIISGKSFSSQIILPSISYEIFHSGALMQDDVFDQNPIRRNKSSLHIQYGGKHSSMAKAVCMGDLGIVMALDMINKSNFSIKVINNAITNQIKVFKLTILGEMKDIELSENKVYEEKDIISMYNLKTSWYTLIGPLQLGAILGGANKTLLNQIEKFGMYLGIAFQIKDDILGIYSAESIIGKSNYSDMREGKKTMLTRHYLDNAVASEITRFEEIYGNDKSGEKELLQLKQMFIKANSLKNAEKLCLQYLKKARTIIDLMVLNFETKKLILSFIDFLEQRNY